MEVFYCEGCGTRVSETAVDAGEALVKDLAVYCPQCVRSNPELQRLLQQVSRSSIPAAKRRLGSKGSGRSTAAKLAPVGSRRSTAVMAFAIAGGALAAFAMALALGGRSRRSPLSRGSPNVDPTRRFAPAEGWPGSGGAEESPSVDRQGGVAPSLTGQRPALVGTSLLTSLTPGGAGGLGASHVEGPQPGPAASESDPRTSGPPAQSPPAGASEQAPGEAPAREPAAPTAAGQARSDDAGAPGPTDPAGAGSAWKDLVAALARKGSHGIAEAAALLRAERERLEGLGLPVQRLDRLELRLRDAEKVEALAADSLSSSRTPVRLRCRDRPVSGKVVKVEKGRVVLRPVLGTDFEVAFSEVLPEDIAKLAGLVVGESADPVRAAAYCLARGDPDAARSLLENASGHKAETLREEVEELSRALAPREPARTSTAVEPAAARPEAPSPPGPGAAGPRLPGAGLPQPLVHLSFDEGSGSVTANMGSTAAAHQSATLVGSPPLWTANVPPGGGASALDFGVVAGPCGVDLPMPEELKGLKSFTITGWVNSRSAVEGGGGNRIVSWSRIDGSADGIDLVFKSDGSLQIGINEHPDNPLKPTRSSPGKITVHPDADPGNWRFFAVTYDSTAPSGHVKFYFGTPTQPAALDVARDWNKGPLGQNVPPCVTIGNFVPAVRTTGNRHDRMFRGLVDEIRIYGSSKDGTGALTLEEVAAVQSARGASALADLARVAPTPEDRRALIAECSCRPLTDGFLLDPGIVASLARRYAADRVVPKKIASIGGAVAASQSSDLRLKRELAPAEGYVFASNVGLAGAGMTLAEIRKSAPRSLDRERPELVRICPDLADILRAKGVEGLKADLAALVEAVQERGAVPVLYTLPAPLSLGETQAENQVTAFNAMAMALAIDAKVPCLDAWRILNDLPGASQGLFRGKAPSQAGYDALAGKFLGLYRLLEKWVMRRRGVSSSVPVGPPAAAAGARPGPVGHWRLDDPPGAVALDSSGRSNHARVLGGPARVAGRLGGAFRFDGFDDRVECPAGGMPALGAPQSHTFWMRYDSPPRSAQVAVGLAALPDRGVLSGFHTLAGRGVELGVWRWGGPFLASTVMPGADAWHHVAYTFDGTTHRLYLNGTLVGSSSVAPQAPAPNALTFGALPSGGELFRGDLDDVRIYDRALDPAEVRELARGFPDAP